VWSHILARHPQLPHHGEASVEINNSGPICGDYHRPELAHLDHVEFTFCAIIMPAPPKIITALKIGGTFSSPISSLATSVWPKLAGRLATFRPV
jgi:hypothetical protein